MTELLIQENQEKKQIALVENGKLIELTFDYDIQDKINYILKDEEIVSKNFDAKITYMVKIKDEIFILE